MKRRGLGRTLTFVLDEKRRISLPQVRAQRSILMNRTRLKLFQDLCRFPCISLSSLARMNSISRTSVKWHLEVLRESNYVSVREPGKGIAYYPAELVKGDEETALLALLNRETARKVYILILGRPGMTQTGIRAGLNIRPHSASWFLKKLSEYGLVSSVSDGKNKRYFPLPLLLELRKRNKDRLKRFRRSLIERLSEEGFAPRILHETEGKITFMTTLEGKAEEMTFCTDPYLGILEG